MWKRPLDLSDMYWPQDLIDERWSRDHMTWESLELRNISLVVEKRSTRAFADSTTTLTERHDRIFKEKMGADSQKI